MAETAPVEAPTAAAPLSRRLLAEFVGTLLFVAAGTGVATVLGLGPIRALGGIQEAFGGATGQEALLEGLLGNSLGDLLAVALTFAFALSILVYALGGVSGAHFNPAVTFGLAVSRRFPWKEVLPYSIIQCLGAIAGAFVVAGIYGNADPSGAQVLFGATTIAEGFNEAQALLAEAFITFILMTAIMAVAVDPRAPKGFSGVGIGLALAAGILVTAAATGASANFARSLGPFVASLFYDTDAPNIPWNDLIIYAAGPLIGAAAAALVYESVTGLEQISPAPRPGAATGTAEAGHFHPANESHVHSHGSEMHSHPHSHEDGPGHDHTH